MQDRLDHEALRGITGHERRAVVAALEHEGARVEHQVALGLAGFMAVALEAMQ